MSGGPDHPVVKDPLGSLFLSIPNGAQLVEAAEGSTGVTYPRGFVAAGVPAGIKESGRPDLGLVAIAPEYAAGAVGAAVFTRNSFAAAPVVVSRREVSLGSLSAVVMNSGNANAVTGAPGLAVARAMQAAAAQALGLPINRVGVGSTGVIGQPLDGAKVVAGIQTAVAALTTEGGPAFAEAIMTTDRFPKVCALDVSTRDGVVRIAGAAKGAGMIAPGLATMLCVVTSDAGLSESVARSMLAREVGRTFNRISVDGQMSTNDTVFLLANGASGVQLSADGAAQLGGALRWVLLRLALMMVADGEGATKVMRLNVSGAGTDEEAQTVARAIAGSPLVQTAMYGCDPNWGRILSAAGAALPGRAFPDVVLEIGGVALLEKSSPVVLDPEGAARLHTVMTGPEVDIRLDLASGHGSDIVYFADIGHEYVTINAEYHT
jgi:glutamate N-acetyltransferase / amino-acid N-acetyltransferase